jgi:hypothetical protein
MLLPGSASWDLSPNNEASEKFGRASRSSVSGSGTGRPSRWRRRLETIVAKLAKKPSVSLPEAMQSESELEGTYRFANNLAGRAARAVRRVRGCSGGGCGGGARHS